MEEIMHELTGSLFHYLWQVSYIPGDWPESWTNNITPIYVLFLDLCVFYVIWLQNLDKIAIGVIQPAGRTFYDAWTGWILFIL